ncbi:MAG: hypothetical protein RR184_02910 [Citrobacter sp.]|uniref:Phage gp6-like head-tail connector protein n=1 Tax=Citrobacter tructae TaxID=2562449 RepID=A0ABX5T3S0_9ENTR|nr:hypothetical protein [Citrobacter tructae]QBX79968.1 hypothetical protein E4Z61_06120 [Citrobacter tructae]
MELTSQLLQQRISLLESSSNDDMAEFALYAARALLAYMSRVESLEKALAVPIKLPYCSASPVCEIEAGYAAGVSDCREAIRQAGYPIDGDD